MPFITGAAILGGAAIGAGGSMLGGAAQNRQGRLARDQYAARTQEGMNRAGMLYFGPGSFMDLLGGTEVDYGGSFRPEALEGALKAGKRPEGMDDAEWGRVQGLYRQWQQMQKMVDAQGGPFSDQIKRFSDQAVSGVDDAYNRVLDRNRAGMAEARGLYQQPISSFQNAAPGILAAAGQQSALAGKYGAEREGVIRRDAGKMNANLDAQTRAMMTASGFGGTPEAMQMAGNARQTQDAMQTSLADLADRKLGAQMQGAQAYQGALQGNAGMLAGLQGQQADALSRLSLQRNMLAGDADQSRVGQRFGYQVQPMQSTMGLLQSSVMNPHLGQNTSQFYPGQTGTSSLGQFGSQLGGSLFGMGMLDLMRGQGGGAGGTNPFGVSQSAYGPFQR